MTRVAELPLILPTHENQRRVEIEQWARSHSTLTVASRPMTDRPGRPSPPTVTVPT